MRTLLLLALLLFTTITFAQTITVQFVGIRSSEGSIRLQVFDSQKNFKDEKPLLIKTISKAGLSGKQLKFELKGLKPGVYGIAILDDENSNQKMDYGLILPKEGFGFSDYYHSSMTRPVFEDFDFKLGTELKKVEVRIRYL